MMKFTSFLFNKDDYIGEVRVHARAGEDHGYLAAMFSGKAMRISDFSPPSDRCPPLLVMHSISSPIFTMDVSHGSDSLGLLYSSCLHDAKTAMVRIESGKELHLVAMCKAAEAELEENNEPCFWGFISNEGTYASCLTMLNSRCLALVFDLDETLLVANTMHSFDIRIEALSKKIGLEDDPEKTATLTAELKRYQEDQSLLTQYMENDRVLDNGKLFKVRNENVPSSGVTPALERPIIRLEERNIILTRINPTARYTSVLVRLRPAWEELKSYLVANGRKRFEVFICTMSEKEYALEMWRLLDPDARLIPSVELEERILCVQGSRKSLANVFKKGQCHPNMSIVVDDRLDVWGALDHHRVNVVFPFAPYQSPQFEMIGGLHVLSIVRNVVSNVRIDFFKDFDENLTEQFSSVTFETDFSTLPKPLDAATFLRQRVSMDSVPSTGGSKGLPDGLADSETEGLLNPELQALQQPQQQQNESEPEEALGENCEEGEVPESELDPDTRRRLLILQHGQDTEHNNRASEEDVSRPGSSENAVEPEPTPIDKHFDGTYGTPPTMTMGLMRPQRQDSRKLLNYSDTDDRAYRINGLRDNSVQQPEPADPIVLLQSMAQKYKAQVEFRSFVCPTIELQFSAEVIFNGERIARSTGRTNKDARAHASEDAVRWLSNELRDPSFLVFLPDKPILDNVSAQWNMREAQNRVAEAPKLPTFNAVAALKDLCTVENLSVSFRDLQFEANPLIHNCEVEVAGRVMGRGRGLSWEAARQEASEEALRNMKSNVNTGKRNPPPRSPPALQGNKRSRVGGRGRGGRISSQLALRLK